MENAWQQATQGVSRGQRKELSKDYRVWNGEAKIACGLPADGKPSDDVISRSQNCILEKTKERTAKLLKIIDDRNQPVQG